MQDLHKHTDQHTQNEAAEALNGATLGTSFRKDEAGLQAAI